MKKNAILKKVTTFLMSLVMVLTLFSGMKMEARATANHTWAYFGSSSVLNGTYDPSDYELLTGETLRIENRTTDTVTLTLTYRANGSELFTVSYIIEQNFSAINSIGADEPCPGYTKWKPSLSGTTCYLDAIIDTPVSPSSPAAPASPEAPASPSTTGGQKDNQRSSSNTSLTSVHTHSYSWVTVQEANSEQDGIEEYRCSCGDVQERNVIPASEAFVKGLFGEIKDAPLNGSTTFDTGRQYTLSDYIIRKLAERTDVTTVITFEYEGQSYRMTIPAGADYSQLLADEDYFYGYFYFADAVGAVIEAV